MVADRVTFYSMNIVLYKGGYGGVHLTVQQQDTAYFYNRITVRFTVRHGFTVRHKLRYLRSPTPPPSFLVAGGTQKKLKNTQQNIQLGPELARYGKHGTKNTGRTGIGHENYTI